MFVKQHQTSEDDFNETNVIMSPFFVVFKSFISNTINNKNKTVHFILSVTKRTMYNSIHQLCHIFFLIKVLPVFVITERSCIGIYG